MFKVLIKDTQSLQMSMPFYDRYIFYQSDDFTDGIKGK